MGLDELKKRHVFNVAELVVLVLLDASCVEEADCLGRTAVIYAVQFSCLDTLQILLEHGANVNAVALGQMFVYSLFLCRLLMTTQPFFIVD